MERERQSWVVAPQNLALQATTLAGCANLVKARVPHGPRLRFDVLAGSMRIRLTGFQNVMCYVTKYTLLDSTSPAEPRYPQCQSECRLTTRHTIC